MLIYLPQIPLTEEWGGSAKTWFNPPKPGPHSRALCGTVCALSKSNHCLKN